MDHAEIVNRLAVLLNCKPEEVEDRVRGLIMSESGLRRDLQHLGDVAGELFPAKS